MTLDVTPKYTATGVNDPTKQISKDRWNLGSAISLATQMLVGRSTAGDGAAEEIPFSTFATAADLSGYVPNTRTVNGHALNANVTVSASDVGLGNVTNDAQTKAAIVPNTAPAAGQILVGNAGGTAYVPVSASGDVSVASTGAHTLATVNANVGSFTGADITVDAKGRITAAANGSGGGGANTALSNLLSVAINTALTTGAGVAAALTATAPVAVSATTAGAAASLTASAATAGTVTNGAAAGGPAQVQAGNAARRVSGNAAGGNVEAITGTGIGTGVAGKFVGKVVGGGGSTGFAIDVSGSQSITFTCSDGSTAANLAAAGFIDSVGSKFRITNLGGITGANDTRFGWGSASTIAGSTLDTSYCRNAAGVSELNDGTKGNVRAFQGGGTAIASATAMPLPTGRVFHVTGTTNITSITATNLKHGVVITLIFDGVLTFTDGNNLKLAGNFVTTADATITLAFDGTNFYECCRSTN